ncbi:TonB-dependent receptor [Novosphingobium sp.]|uniref:TonB-dependent receptor n=1 Tax=Novosphingobium sp. TaxID=1874826 RepID=UPI0033429552
MRGKLCLLVGVCAAALSNPVFAQQAKPAAAEASNGIQEIIVTAQRQSQRLQEVPIAVSAFNAQALERQQIKTTSDLQLSLPNVTFSKTNFTTSSFTIRGIGQLCVGESCEPSTAIHLNDSPLSSSTRLFEGQFYDLAQIEVLRGPQGTLFGRNATGGVVNIHTAPPVMGKFEASADAEYGNYNDVRVKGMINVPLGETVAVRAAGFYQRRDGYTKNLYDGTKIDSRDNYGLRASLRWEPSSRTTFDIVGQYFHEKDSRMRSQKQECQTDPTGVLGCLSGELGSGVTNGNSLLGSILTSKELFAVKGLPAALALGSIYGPNAYGTAINPTDPRAVYTAYTPTYYSVDTIIQARLKQEIGDNFELHVDANYEYTNVDSTQDYNNQVEDRSTIQSGLNTLYALGNNLVYPAGDPRGPVYASYLGPVSKALMPNGPGGKLCTSAPTADGTGVFGGHAICSMAPLQLDRSDEVSNSWSAEAIFSSKLSGPFNFLVGGIYSHYKINYNDYFVNNTGLDYFGGVAGTFTAFASGKPASFLATPYYDNNTNYFGSNSYGLFGEAYFKVNDKLKLTAGLRYNHDEKVVSAHTSTFNALVPFGTTNAQAAILAVLPNAVQRSQGHALTGRAVLDWQVTPNNLIYLSYSRGYKGGGFNPPLSEAVKNLGVPTTFAPETVDSFEIGSKNSFGNGQLQLNLTGFYYNYKNLQLSAIVARTSLNENISAHVYGLEAEAVLRPIRAFTVNISASYLHTEVSQDALFGSTRDPGAGRADAVIIKDLANSSNCAVAPNTVGNAAGANAFVNEANTFINNGLIAGIPAGAGLQPTQAFPSNGGIKSTGAYSICDVLVGLAGAPANLGGGLAFDPKGISVFLSGIPINLKGHQLPGAPNYKVSIGAQYEIPVNTLKLTPRVDVHYTGESTGSVFNGRVNAVPSYIQVNAQLQLDGPDRKWYLKAFVENLTNSNSITGEYVTDQSSGLFTNIFTLDPRRYGVAAGFKF